MPAAQYTLRTLIPFTAPVHPGHLPVYASGTTGPIVMASDRLYDKRARDYKEYLTAHSCGDVEKATNASCGKDALPGTQRSTLRNV
jgi:hypothetical protein